MSRQLISLSTLSVCLGYSIALIPGNTSPLIVGGLISGLGLGIADSGMVLSVELILMGIAATSLAPFMSHTSTRKICIAGAGLLLLGHSFASIATNLEQVLLFRSLAGIGAGTVLAAVNASIAGAPNPPRLYGFTMMAPPLIGSVIALLMSRAVASFEHSGAYATLALLTLLVIPFLRVFPDYRKNTITRDTEKIKDYETGVALLFVILITGASMMAYFVFVERLGDRLGLSIESIGNIIAWVVLCGSIGAAIAFILEDRFGLMKPLVIGITLHSATMITVIQVQAIPVYVVVTILEAITMVFTLTVLFSIAAKLDNRGRWAAAAGGAFSLSLGVGPYLGGAIIELAGFGALNMLIIICTLIIYFLLYWISRRSHIDSASG